MEYEHILALIDRVSEAGLSSFTYEADGIKISMKGKPNTVCVPVQASAPVQPQQPASVIQPMMSAEEQPVFNGNTVNSPLVGTFYAAPSEDAEPYVQVGDQVKKGQVLAIVEAMKLMNEIESDYDGVITDILVKNGEPVEYGQPLFCIEKSSASAAHKGE